MARTQDGTRSDTITLVAADDPLVRSAPGVDNDIEDSFDDWREGLKNTSQSGTVRAYRIPVDDNLVPNGSAKNQILLGSWPVDQYSMEELCQKLKREFMQPHERFMGLRLIGTMSGERGIRFNKLVTVQRPNEEAAPRASGGESVTEMLRAISENNARMMAVFENRLSQPAQPPPAQNETITMVATLMGAMGQFMQAVKPATSTGGMGSLKEMVEVMTMLNDMRGDSGGGGDDNGLAGIVKALAPMAGPVFQLAANAQTANIEAARRAPQRRALPAPAVAPASGPAPAARPAPPVQAPVNPAPQVPNNTGEPMLAELSATVAALVQIAEAGTEPIDAANLFFDETLLPLPDNGYEQMCTFVADPNAINKLGMLNKGVAAHREWFEKCLARVRERIAEENAAAAAEDIPAAP